jgi:diaminopimelate epimerase
VRSRVVFERDWSLYNPMTSPLQIPFRKMNGLGNEIVVVDFRKSNQRFTARQAAEIADNARSHFDQMMVLHAPKAPGTEAFVRIYNTDGSEAQACGNGTRCIGWLVAGQTGKSALKFETVAGILDVTVAGIGEISVDMGQPRFGWAEIPLVEAFHDTRHVELQVGPIDAPLIHSPSVVNMGNPHAVFWVDRLDVIDLGKVGPMLEHHRLFPERANISLAQVLSRSEIRIKTWERGAGLTRACGSAACAAAVCAARKGLTDRAVTVQVPGGPLRIEWTADDRVIMTGPVEDEYADVVAVV